MAKIWNLAASAFLGMAYGGLMGITYLFARKYLPLSDDRKKAILLAGLMFLAFYIVPFSKYPPNPPAVGNPHRVGYCNNIRYVKEK